jgi:hemerythrin
MPLMEWNDKLATGVGVFDGEHKKLVGMVNNLYDAVQGGQGKDALGKILDGLIDYTKSHFGREEEYMTKHAYPDIAAHKKEHADLARQVLDVQAKYKAGATSTLSLEVLNFLKNWLIKHIQGTDKKYGPFLNAKGVR